jgi:hypothetical protein
MPAEKMSDFRAAAELVKVFDRLSLLDSFALRSSFQNNLWLILKSRDSSPYPLLVGNAQTKFSLVY